MRDEIIKNFIRMFYSKIFLFIYFITNLDYLKTNI